MEGSYEQTRVCLNVGGQIFETFIGTLLKFPNSLLGAMFQDRNVYLLKPDENGIFFFDRSPVAFESILNFYRTGKFRGVAGMSKQALQEEIDYWQLPFEVLQDEEKIGNKISYIALDVIRKKVQSVLEKIVKHILERIEEAAQEGAQSCSIEFRETKDDEFYGFLSNFSNRELLLHDLLQENLDVSFNEMTSVTSHSYILLITLWNRYTRQKYGENVTTSLAKILGELRQGVEIKTSKIAHILTVKPIFD